MKKVFILGAGLSGLSLAYHLQKRKIVCQIFEREKEIGGLASSKQISGFYLDHAGHLLHFKHKRIFSFVKGLLGNSLIKHKRNASIYSFRRFVPYPFQVSLFALPQKIKEDCLKGFIEAKEKNFVINNFQDWIMKEFGKGIARYFMVPYNQKLWQHDLHDIALDWVNWSIPKPDLEDVINGALGIKNRQFGYNPVFFYPREGGIGLFPESFPVSGKRLFNQSAEKIDLKKHCVLLNNGEVIRYRWLLSTMPLHRLVLSLKDPPGWLLSACKKLEYVSVLNINLGIDRPDVLPFHWVYFPEEDKPFYRIGCPSNFSRTVAPKGTTSLFMEISLKPDQNHDIAALTRECIESLKKCKILRPEDKIVSMYPILLEYAYVIYNSARSATVKKIHAYLNRHHIYSFGRYGSWIYSSMEDAVLEGKSNAERVIQISG
ncbi:MAG: FAD-dependent oxidoreductase [Candidatus Omnitrophica bacterium]|nr:FAD-dependent oxidoreductase [Candidatus Omnitrophota bacterium]